jgi:O-antigen ligase
VLLAAPLLAMIPRGMAPLAAFAGLCGLALIAARPAVGAGMNAMRRPAVLLGALLLWGMASALWSIDAGRSVMLDFRLAGLFAAALAMTAAVGRIAAPWRLALCLFAGTAIGILMAGIDWESAGGLSRLVSVRAFLGPRLNQIAVWLAILTLPTAALLACRRRWLLAMIAAAIMAGTVFDFEGTTAKTALLLGLPVAGLLYVAQRFVARLAAVVAVIAIITAPLTLPRLDHLPNVFSRADTFKVSAGHRLMIWAFTGDRIAERPAAGWGLDSSRNIPGGNVEIRPGETWLPLHPHDAALQVWLELGAPGAVLFAALIGLLWLRLAEAPWPRLYAAAAGGSLTTALAVALAGWGIWQEWWLSTLSLALFVTLTMARATVVGRKSVAPSAVRHAP